MSLTRTTRTRPRLPQLAFSLILVVAFAAHASGQAKPTVMVEHVSFPAYPVEVIGVEVAGETHDFTESQPRQFMVSFAAPGDWLRHLVFEIKNKSDKTVVGAMLYGSLKVGEDGEIGMGIEARFGQELDESAFTGRAPRGEPRRLAPG